ncbi:hypothetical protein PCASD_04671 [Puccinia coronata f. sp. avenae]|uniref:Uncharacterized protein n=1 Tax=Puccinia coronata f. sp. avenae TaxID=200324 RepID=A0A2N5UXH8_9BASI|nr:hypothetical protein PCASD_04671 [Puccinia coronata f. sp. avenae]
MSTSTALNSTASQTLASLTASASALATSQAAIAKASAALTSSEPTSSPAYFKIIGIILALVSGLFIGSSFVFKKKGLLISQQKVLEKGGEAGESHAYLKSPMWWAGMSLMIIGEICNFVAYAFADAILVTPMGALSVVISAVLSSIFLKERLSFFGKVGCFLCVLGATIIAVNGPKDQAVSTIPEFERLFLAPGFLVFASIVVVSALGLIFVAAPRWGKTNMLVYISICSIIGGLSVVATQGLGASIITTFRGESQFKYWFMYFLIGFVVCTLLTEINYLNKALELYNTAMVTPTYYVMFTFSTLVTSIILFQGLKAPAADIITLVLGFLVICCGITLLQMSKVDPIEIAGLDSKSAVFLAADKEVDSESGLGAEEPGVDGLRGFGGVIGSMHRNTLIARQSNASSLAALSDQNSFRRRRQETYLRNLQERNLEIGMSGLKRHSLWDRPVSDEALQGSSRHHSTHGSISDPDQTLQLQPSNGADIPAPNEELHSQSSAKIARLPGSTGSEKSTIITHPTTASQYASGPAPRTMEASSKNPQAVTAGPSAVRQSTTGGGGTHVEPGSSTWTSSPVLQSTSPPVRARHGTTDSQQNALNFGRARHGTTDSQQNPLSGLVRARHGTTDSQSPLGMLKGGGTQTQNNNVRSSTMTSGTSNYERAGHNNNTKSKDRHPIGGKSKKFQYDQTELQSLVGPSSASRASSISSSISFSSDPDDPDHSFTGVNQPVSIDQSTDQIRIVATHLPALSPSP